MPTLRSLRRRVRKPPDDLYRKRARPNSRKKRRARWRAIRREVAAGPIYGTASDWQIITVYQERSWYFGRRR